MPVPNAPDEIIIWYIISGKLICNKYPEPSSTEVLAIINSIRRNLIPEDNHSNKNLFMRNFLPHLQKKNIRNNWSAQPVHMMEYYIAIKIVG